MEDNSRSPVSDPAKLLGKHITRVCSFESYIFDPALLELEVAIAKNVVYFHRNE
jgi:hypothetical protein